MNIPADESKVPAEFLAATTLNLVLGLSVDRLRLQQFVVLPRGEHRNGEAAPFLVFSSLHYLCKVIWLRSRVKDAVSTITHEDLFMTVPAPHAPHRHNIPVADL